MSPDAVIGWVLTTAAGLRLSQAKTLAELVEAAARVSRGTPSAIGRCPRGTAAKHAIKRVWRFCDNDRVHPSDVMPRVVRRVTRRRKKPLLVALDWTGIGGFHTLVAAAVMRGRAVPLLWASYTTGQLHRSQNSFEEGLLRLLAAMLPPKVKVILLADRGFGRAELAKTCEGLKLRYLIRIKPDVRASHPSYTGRLDEYPTKKGTWRVLTGAEYRSDKAVALNVVVRWKKGLPAGRDGPWFLMTNLEGNAVRLTGLYARRMAVEELFRDKKDGRYGLGLAQTQVTTAARLDRLILILALAIILLIGLGRLARSRFRPGAWCSSNDESECSDVTVGRRMWERIDQPPERLIDEVVRATLLYSGKLGMTRSRRGLRGRSVRFLVGRRPFAERAAGSVGEESAESVVLAQDGGAQLEDRFGPVVAGPILLLALHAGAHLTHQRFHQAARRRQPLAPVSWVRHARLIVPRVRPRPLHHTARIVTRLR